MSDMTTETDTGVTPANNAAYNASEKQKGASKTSRIPIKIVPIADGERLKKPDWIRVKAATASSRFYEIKQILREHKLHSVCEEASCPNIGECWQQKHATVMILGDTCTRACAFCNVRTGMPGALDQDEPQKVADAVVSLAESPAPNR